MPANGMDLTPASVTLEIRAIRADVCLYFASDCNARRAKKSTKWSAGQRAANARPFSSLFSRAASLSDGIGAQREYNSLLSIDVELDQ